MFGHNRATPKSAIRIERRVWRRDPEVEYIVDDIYAIEALIQNMEKDPTFHKNSFVRSISPKARPNLAEFSVTRQSLPSFNGIPTVAKAEYFYSSRSRGFAFGVAVAIILIPIIAVALGLGLWAEINTRAWELATIPPEPACTLFLRDNKPVGIDVFGDLMEYDASGHVDPIWEGTATYDQLQMAYKPIAAGCAIVHLDSLHRFD